MKHYSLGNRQCYRTGDKDLGLGGFTQGTQVCMEVLRENRKNTFYIHMLINASFMCSSTQTTQNTFQMVKMVMNCACLSKIQN